MQRRFRGVEFLDDPDVDDSTRLAAMHDLARANSYFGGARIVLDELWRSLGPEPPSVVSVLDVGSGIGDIALRARCEARERGVRLDVIGVDVSAVVADAATDAGMPTVTGDARTLPFPERSFDVVLCSQLLHHFCDEGAITILRELDRVARMRVIVGDLRRSWLAAGAFWLTAGALRFHRVSRHDGLVSVLRGFRPAELRRLIRNAVGATPDVRRRLGFRLIASWAPVNEWRRGRDRQRNSLTRQALGADRRAAVGRTAS